LFFSKKRTQKTNPNFNNRGGINISWNYKRQKELQIMLVNVPKN
jgi:hypothetical protein